MSTEAGAKPENFHVFQSVVDILQPIEQQADRSVKITERTNV